MPVWTTEKKFLKAQEREASQLIRDVSHALRSAEQLGMSAFVHGQTEKDSPFAEVNVFFRPLHQAWVRGWREVKKGGGPA